MRTNNTALFLHGGPGQSAQIESLWFGADLPMVWWDQPLMGTDGRAHWDVLQDAAEAEVRRLARQQGAPVDLVAHSFGGQLAISLAQRAPELIGNLTLLACTTDPVRAVVRLAERLQQHAALGALQQALDAARREMSLAHFEALVLALAGHPAYPAINFAPAATDVFQRFLAWLPQVRFLDLPTFFGVMRSFLQPPALPVLDGLAGGVTLYLGRQDPLLRIEEERSAWRRVFPRVQVHEVDAGHFVHLELPVARWWPTGILAPR